MSEKKTFVKNSSARTIHTLDFVMKRGSVTLSEVADELEVDKSSAYRILKTIENEGYIRNSNRKYTVGYKLAERICFEKNTYDVCNAAQPILNNLISKFDGSAHICVLTRSGPAFLAQKLSNSPIHVVHQMGQTEPFYCTASGKAMLAFLPEEIRENILSNMQLLQYTNNTITDMDSFRHELERVRRQGYATDIEEYHYNMSCVCAPVFDKMNISRYSIGISCVTRGEKEGSDPELLSKFVINGAKRLSLYLSGADVQID